MSTFATFRLILVYVRNSSSGEGDPQARINFDQRLHEVAVVPAWIPTVIAGDMNVSPTSKGVISPTTYTCDPTTLTGFLPHEVHGHNRLIELGYIANFMENQRRYPIHNAGGMGAYDGIRHHMQVFDFNRIYMNERALKLYVTTLYRSVSALGEEAT